MARSSSRPRSPRECSAIGTGLGSPAGETLFSTRPLSIESLDLYWVRLFDLDTAPGRRQIIGVARAIGIEPALLATATGATVLFALLAVVATGTYGLWTLVRAGMPHPAAPDEHSF